MTCLKLLLLRVVDGEGDGDFVKPARRGSVIGPNGSWGGRIKFWPSVLLIGVSTSPCLLATSDFISRGGSFFSPLREWGVLQSACVVLFDGM
jgi:hypothetical protein